MTSPGTTPPTDVETQYQEALGLHRLEARSEDWRHARLGAARLTLAGAALVVLLFQGFGRLDWLATLAAAFLVVAVFHARVLGRRTRAEAAASFYERGLGRMQHTWIGHGRQGESYAPVDHTFAGDLDLFGRGSLFELLAPSRTQAG